MSYWLFSKIQFVKTSNDLKMRAWMIHIMRSRLGVTCHPDNIDRPTHYVINTPSQMHIQKCVCACVYVCKYKI